MIKFMTERDLPSNMGISGGAANADGYRYINILVQFTPASTVDKGVDLGVVFYFDADSKYQTRRYVNLEENLPDPQLTNYINVSGEVPGSGGTNNISSYLVRLPVMGPYFNAFVYNRMHENRKVTVWAYLVS